MENVPSNVMQTAKTARGATILNRRINRSR